MPSKQFEYAITGFIIGAIVGALLGFFSLNQIKKSQRATMLPYAIGIGAILIGAGGYNYGSKLGKNAYVEERLGINKAKDSFFKDGRYWVGTTVWIDRRDLVQHTLMTARSQSGVLVSTIDNKAITNHEIRNANQQSVPRYHGFAKVQVFNILKENFRETATPIDKLIPTI